LKYFKGDAGELKMIACGQPILDQASLAKDEFFEGAYEAAQLGDVLYETNRTPLANAILQSIFRTSFKQIFDAFVSVGTFESYLTVFRKIFGDDVVVNFTVPGNGKLNIAIEATGVELSDFIARYIQSNVYLFDEVVDEEDDNIAFQTIKGFTSQYELEQMLFEMVPAGVYTEITLDLGA
jgi:hypothetical protein